MTDMFEEHERRELIRFGNTAFDELLQRLHRAQTGSTGARQPNSRNNTPQPHSHHHQQHPQQQRFNSSSSNIHGSSNTPAAPSTATHSTTTSDNESKYITVLEQHKIYATLEEIADLYISDEKKMVLDFSESRELAVLQRATRATPMAYTGLRWSLFKSPNRHLAKGQDFCYLEVMRPYIATSGRRAWAKLSHSIETTICPDFSRTLNVYRGQLYYCGVFFEETSQQGVLRGYFYYNVDKTRIPAILAPAIMKARGKSNAELINHYAKMSRLLVTGGGASSQQAASLAQQLKAEERCGACSNRMPKWKSKHTCHFCNAFMCKKCCKIVAKNYRVESLECKKKQACFACADEHGVKLTRMDDEDSSSTSSQSRSRTNSSASSARDLMTSSFASTVPPSPAASSSSIASSSRQSSRAASEPLYRHQQYRELQQQQRRQAELLRHRSQTDGIPQRIRLDSSTSSTTSSTNPASEHAARRVLHQESYHRQQQRQIELLEQRLRTDPFAAGRPLKAMSEQGYSSASAVTREPTAASGVRRPKSRAAALSRMDEKSAPTVAALDLSYLSSFK